MNCLDLYRFTRIAQVALSPSGDAVAYVTRQAHAQTDSYEHELFVNDAALGTGLHEPAWSPDGRLLAAVRPGPDASTELIVMSLDGVSQRRISVDLNRVRSLAWSPTGDALAFLAPSTGSGHGGPVRMPDLGGRIDGLPAGRIWRQDLYVVDLATDQLLRLSSAPGWVDGFAFSSDGAHIAYCTDLDRPGSPRQPGTVRPSILRVFERETGDSRSITPPEYGARSPAFSPHGQYLVFTGLTGQHPEPLSLFLVDADGAAITRIANALSVVVDSAGSHGGSSPSIGADGNIYFRCRRDGSVLLQRVAPDGAASPQRFAGSDTESVSAVSVSPRQSRIAYVVTTLDGGNRLEIRDVASDEVTTVARYDAPVSAVTAKRWSVQAPDGPILHGWLIRSDGAVRGPLLVDVHGGSFSGAWAPQVDPSRLYQQELAKTGWTILLLNCRGSDGYGREFARAAIGKWGEADGPDLIHAVDELIRQGLVDSGAVAVTGYSYGGFMSLWLTSMTDRFSSAVAGGAICDFLSLYGTSDMGWAMCRYDIGVSPDTDPAGAWNRSPAARASKVSTPTLLLHGESDQRCPISQAEEWLSLTEDSGARVELVRYPGANHSFLADGPPSYTVDYGQRLVRWVRGEPSNLRA